MENCDLISLSIVSHGQGIFVAQLLDDIGSRNWNDNLNFEVIVTLNIPEDEAWLEREFPFHVKIIRNVVPKGFGANHNTAFEFASGAVFAVVNPDIRLLEFHVAPLLNVLCDPTTGVCAPRVLGPDGALQDSARRFPTVMRLASRVLLRQRRLEYSEERRTIRVDWLAGMFLMFRSEIFNKVGGFDERYFMYMEDADICRNLSRSGFRVLRVGETAIMHDARRASRRNIRHFFWHLTSLFKYLSKSRRIA